MTPQEVVHIKNTLSLLGRTRSKIPFLYCPAGEEGLPVLLVAPKRLDPEAIFHLTQNARSKNFVRGFISRRKTKLLFTIERGDPASLVVDLGGILDEQIPGLRLAQLKPTPTATKQP
mgnify:CR=1 FL=1